MTRYRVDCIIPDGADKDRRIDSLGGTYPFMWKMHIDEVISRINRNSDQFFVLKFGMEVAVLVRKHGPYGPQYLTTERDSFPPNNLLNLPRCFR